MLTTDSSATDTNRSSAKTVETRTIREEAKTPEAERVVDSGSSPSSQSSKRKVLSRRSPKRVTPNKKASSPLKSSSTSRSRSGKKGVSPTREKLSARAMKVKERLNIKKEVSAVILRMDGSSEEIKYNTSSKQVNELLHGRPTIIGELEDIQVIIVRALRSNGLLNQHVLPVPFCNKQYKGDYLLYRMDVNGNPIDLSLKQYEKYVADNKTLTEQAKKNFNPVDNQEIKAKSSFNSNSRLTLVYLRSEVDRKIREEFKEKHGRKPTQSEIEESVNKELQKLVDELVLRSSPMNDPDYNPIDDEKKKDDNDKDDDDDVLLCKLREIYKEETGFDVDGKDLAQTLCNAQRMISSSSAMVSSSSSSGGQQGFIVDEEEIFGVDDRSRDWRLQLNDALRFVRERGRVDGRILAEKVAQTFYELNGVEPTLDQLIDVFRRIKNELAVESEEDALLMIKNEEKEKYDDEPDNGTAYYLAKKLGTNLCNADPTDLVDYAYRIVREDLINRAKSSFVISKGRTPTKLELEQTLQKFAIKLVDEALKTTTRTRTRTRTGTGTGTGRKTRTRKSGGVGVGVNDEDNKLMDPDYDPNNMDDAELEKSDKMEDEEFDENYFNLRMLTTPRIKSQRGLSETYDVYFCRFDRKREEKNLLKAIESFKMRNKREPNDLEINRLRKFLTTNKDTSLVQFKLSVVSDSDDVDNNIDHDREEKDEYLRAPKTSSSKPQSTTPSKVLVTPVKKKKSAARYNVYFENNELDERKNEKMALKWFKRFNNRKPTELELAGIKQFIKADKSQLTECEYEVPVVLSASNLDDDGKQTEEDDNKMVVVGNSNSNSNSNKKKKNNNNNNNKKMKTDYVVEKKSATKYTLNFDDDEERPNGDEKQAIKWFKRFNNRNPTKDEQEKIKQFITADNQDEDDTVDID